MMLMAAQNITRSAKLDHNLKDQIEWLTDNFQDAYNSGFNYAHKVSKDVSAPTVFNFDNPKRRASNNSTLASVSQVGDFELQSFRLHDSPCRNVNRNGNGNADGTDFSGTASDNYNAHSSSSSAKGYNGYDQNGCSDGSSSNARRPTAGSFLGTGTGTGSRGSSGGYQPGNSAYDNRNIQRSDGNYDRTGGPRSGGYSGEERERSSSLYPTVPPFSNNTVPPFSGSNSDISRGGGNSSNGNAYGGMGDSTYSNTVPYRSYCDDISDSQLAVLDLDGESSVIIYYLLVISY